MSQACAHPAPLRRLARWIAVGAALALVAGCTTVFPGGGEPPRLFTLTPENSFANDLPTARWQLVIEEPVAAESLDTSRIAVQHTALSLQYYKQVRWAERAPLMIQALLVESFENTGKIVAVGRLSVDLRADYVLKTDLREFQAEYRGGENPVARVRLIAKLVKLPERAIIASHAAEDIVRAKGPEIDDVVVAFDAALGNVLKSIVEWTLRAPQQRAP